MPLWIVSKAYHAKHQINIGDEPWQSNKGIDIFNFRHEYFSGLNTSFNTISWFCRPKCWLFPVLSISVEIHLFCHMQWFLTSLYFPILALPSHTFVFTFDYMHSNTCMYFTILAVIMSVFSSPMGSPGWPDLDQSYPISLSDDLREDALHDLMERIDIREGLVSPNPWSGTETKWWQHRTQPFVSLETQTQQSPQAEQEPNSAE